MWLLIIFVMTGQNHHFQTIEFTNYESCESVRAWTVESADNLRDDRFKPNAICVKK